MYADSIINLYANAGLLIMADASHTALGFNGRFLGNLCLAVRVGGILPFMIWHGLAAFLPKISQT